MLKLYQQKLQRYEQILVGEIQHEYPLSNETQNKLKCLQQVLHLRDEDTARITSSSELTKIIQAQPLCRREKVPPTKLLINTGVTSRTKIPWFSNIKLPRVSAISVAPVVRNPTLLIGASVFIIGILTCGATLQPRHQVDSIPNVSPTASSISQMSAEAFHSRGVNKYFNADYQGAIEDSNQAIQLDFNNAPVYYNRGIASLN